MPNSDIKAFYENWRRDEALAEQDAAAGQRKAESLIDILKASGVGSRFSTVVDYGCGYGSILNALLEQKVAVRGLGFDCSQYAVAYASKRSTNPNAKFYCLPGLDIEANVRDIQQKMNQELGVDRVDGILLIDLLEHVPDCLALVEALSRLTKAFIIKLPLEKSVLDNYVLRHKDYPGPSHVNGHLREFDVNDVHYFVRSLGLGPVAEAYYLYDINDACPPIKADNWRLLAKYHVSKFLRLMASSVLPKKVSLKAVGGGGYVCVAEFNREFVLKP